MTAVPDSRSTQIAAPAGVNVAAFAQWAVLFAIVAIPRLLVFGVNENWFGDAVIRSELGERWVINPHPFGSFAQGAWQFGPLHLYLLAFATKLWPVREHVGRLLSLFFAVLTVVPLRLLTRRLFGDRAAFAAVAALSTWGMHIQFSTTAASESLGVLLVLGVAACFARGFLDGHRPSILAAALLLTLACATRYDAWLWIPLLTAMLALARRWSHAFWFGAGAMAFPLAWLHGNWGDLGDPFYALKFVDAFHREWFPREESYWGFATFRLMNLLFWPGALLFTLTPLVGALAVFGAWKMRRERRVWCLFALIVLPAALFTFRSTLMGTFVPLARFTAKELALALPFVGAGLIALPWRRAGTVVFGSAVVFSAALGLFTLHREGKWEDTLRPVSPTSTNPAAMMNVARYLKRELGTDGALILDDDPLQYRDMQIAFFTGLPEPRLARFRWEIFWVRIATAEPRWLLLIDSGTLVKSGAVRVEGEQAFFNGWAFERVNDVTGPYRLYRRR